MQGIYDVGIDIGSVSVNLVVMNPEGQVLREVYRRHLGETYPIALTLLKELEPEFPLSQCRLAAFTGLGGKVLAEILGGPFINEVIAQARGTCHFHPDAKSIIDMGGEDAKLIMVDQEDGQAVIQDFAMNTMCAAGTGSFLDQQAHRLGYTIEAFSEMALKSTTPPRIAGRCSVFAKTDMIHLQQGATPDYEIIYGLCQAMARNLKSNIAKGKTLATPVVFQGGVAHNLGVRQAFRGSPGTGRCLLHHPAPLLRPGRGGRGAGGPGKPARGFPAQRAAPGRLSGHDQQRAAMFRSQGGTLQTAPRVHPVIADTRFPDRIRAVFEQYRPEMVFHAAAHKHVPLKELNPADAVTNNVLGTWNMATLSADHGVERFVLVSTDKAVNPTSIMGATKRVAELIVHDVARRTKKELVIVRFGNVLGSRGSVIPVLQQQIEAGGPVTVTHPDVKRYFMTIPAGHAPVLRQSPLSSQRQGLNLPFSGLLKEPQSAVGNYHLQT